MISVDIVKDNQAFLKVHLRELLQNLVHSLNRHYKVCRMNQKALMEIHFSFKILTLLVESQTLYTQLSLR